MHRCVNAVLAVVAGFAGFSSATGVASADSLEQSPALQLRWQAPPECPPASEVRDNVVELAEVEESAPGLRAEAVIRRDGNSWRLELTTEYEGSEGERVLSASSCQALADAATLTLALILNPDVELPEERHDDAPALRLAVSARAGVQIGVLKKLGPDFELGVGLVGNGPSLFAYAGFAPPQEARVRGSSGPGGRVWSGSATLLGCWDFLEATPIGPCAGAELRRVAGRGIAVTNPADGSAYWSSGVIGARGGLRISRSLTLRLQGFALVPAQRPGLFLDEVGLVVRPARVGATVHAGADFELR